MAKAVYDITLDSNDDVAIIGHDFAITESTAQHQRLLILTGKGDWKQHPTIGVGAEGYVDDDGAQNIIRAIAEQFMIDGMEVLALSPNPISIADNTVKIFEQAFYK